MASTISKESRKEFFNYMMSFYGPVSGIYSDFFDHNLTEDELNNAIDTLLACDREFCGDSFDREVARDIIFYNRGERDLEYNIPKMLENKIA